MDVKAKIEEIIKEIEKNPALLKNFKSKPVETVKSLLKVDLPEDALNAVVAGVKAKLNGKDAAEALNTLSGLFGKK